MKGMKIELRTENTPQGKVRSAVVVIDGKDFMCRQANAVNLSQDFRLLVGLRTDVQDHGHQIEKLIDEKIGGLK